MGVSALAAEVVIINIVAFLFMMPLGISFAASSLVGGAIGEQDIPKARCYARQALFLTMSLTTFVVFLMILFNQRLASLFSSDPEVIEQV
jgi:MATE family multidrug resistance protein